MKVDLDDMRPANLLLEVIGCDGALRLHLPSAEFPIRYLVGSQTLISNAEMGNVISHRNKTTWPNTDNRLNSEEFYDPCISRGISIREMRW